MKVLIAGATGAIGTPLSHRLISAGHEVIGLTRTSAGAAKLSGEGVQPIVADALHRDGLLRALDGVSADAVVHQLTSLSKPPARHSDMAQTNRLRTDGTRNLLEAAHILGAGTFITQSIVFGYGYADHGPKVITEDQPFGGLRGGTCDQHVAAMLANEEMVRHGDGISGIALRYGLFYGADLENMIKLLGKRGLPVPSKRNHMLPWIHIDDAATATVAALERGEPGQAYNIVDDQPASWTEMFTAMARTFDAPAPRTLPGWVIRSAAPYVGAMVLDTSMRVSNTKAKAQLGWKPAYPTYREGLRALAKS